MSNSAPLPPPITPDASALPPPLTPLPLAGSDSSTSSPSTSPSREHSNSKIVRRQSSKKLKLHLSQTSGGGSERTPSPGREISPGSKSSPTLKRRNSKQHGEENGKEYKDRSPRRDSTSSLPSIPAPITSSTPSTPTSTPPKKVKRSNSVNSKPMKIKSNSMSINPLSSIAEGAIPPPLSNSGSGLLAPLPPPVAVDDIKRVERRKKIAFEICASEDSYCIAMQLISDTFIKPLKNDLANSKKPLLPSAEIPDFEVLFSTWDTLLSCHIGFRESLKALVANWSDEKELGKLILENTKFIKLYKHYVNNYDKLISTLSRCLKAKKKFDKFVKGLTEREDWKGLTLHAYLIMPVQRIPRYVLLVQDLQKNTLSTHPDYNQLTQALGIIQTFAEFINKSKADYEMQHIIDSMKDRITTEKDVDIDNVLKGRRWIKEGVLTVSNKAGKEGTDMMVFLVNDQIIFCKIIKKDSFKLSSAEKLLAKVSSEGDSIALDVSSASGRYYLKAPATLSQIEGIKELNDWKVKLDQQIKETLQKMVSGEDQAEEKTADGMMLGTDEDNKKKLHLIRQKIVSELIAKEEEYVSRVGRVPSFVDRLKVLTGDKDNTLTPAEIQSCFSNLDEIARAHINLLNQLNERMKIFDTKPEIGDIFTTADKATMLGLYRPYFEKQPLMAANLNYVLEKKPFFVLMISQWEKEGNKDGKVFKTEQVFDLPLKRIESLYFSTKELLRNTPKEHPDYENLIQTVKALQIKDDELKRLLPQPNTRDDRRLSRSSSVTAPSPSIKKK